MRRLIVWAVIIFVIVVVFFVIKDYEVDKYMDVVDPLR